MATAVEFQSWIEYVHEKVVDWDNDTFTYALTNSAPNAATNTVLANITEITYTNLSSRVATVSAAGQSGGTYTATVDQLVLTASGGTVGPFRYVVFYDDTPTSPANPLVAYWDYGSSITLADGETITLSAWTWTDAPA